VALGVFEQHRAIACSRIEVACKERNRTCRLPKDAAKGQGMLDGAALVDRALDDPQRLVHKSLQPQDACLKVMCRHPHIEAKPNNLCLMPHISQAREHAIDMVTRAGLVAQIM